MLFRGMRAWSEGCGLAVRSRMRRPRDVEAEWQELGQKGCEGGVTQVRTLSLMYLLNASRYFP